MSKKKIYAKAVFFDREITALLYTSSLDMAGLEGSELRAVKRLIREFETDPKFIDEEKSESCKACGAPTVSFKLDSPDDGLWIKVRREDRKPTYDIFVEKTLERKPPERLVRKLRKVAKALGYLTSFEDHAFILEGKKALELEEGVEIEEVEEWEDGDGEPNADQNGNGPTEEPGTGK